MVNASDGRCMPLSALRAYLDGRGGRFLNLIQFLRLLGSLRQIKVLGDIRREGQGRRKGRQERGAAWMTDWTAAAAAKP